MLKLETKLKLDKSVAEAPNLTAWFSEDDLHAIGEWAYAGYDLDKNSRADWLRRNEAGMDLALQLQKQKSFPWPGASNVAFPLVTIAALQFHSRAYPTLISGTSIVKARVPGPDPTGELTQRALRVGQFMSYQVLEQDQSWEEQHDRLLLQVPIVGCAFVKTRYDAGRGHNVSELVPAVSLVMDYYAKSVESCGRKTQVIPFFRNEVYERVKSGVWRDILSEPWYLAPRLPERTPEQASQDKRMGINPGPPDEATPLAFLEQHCFMDADGDGYAEPYTILLEANSHEVVRITARWDREEDVQRDRRGDVVRIVTTEHYTKYGLIPSADGSVYDMGFGVLVGPLNESVNSLVNQLIDAGTMSNAAGGFLSRGVKVRGGVYNFQPFGWQRVDSTGDDLRKGIFPLPVREPSTVLFQLLSFLVNYTQRVSGSTDSLAGENPGQNTPASTNQSMVEQGMKIYAALYKRSWRSMKEEFSKLYVLNTKHLPATVHFGGGRTGREDFLGDPSQICPVADPNVSSDLMRLQQAMTLAERAGMVAGYDREAVERNLLQAMKVDGVDKLFPGIAKTGPMPNPKMMVEEAKGKVKMQVEQLKLQEQQLEFIATMQLEAQKTEAEITNLTSQAELFAAQAAAVPDQVAVGHTIELINAMIGAAKLRSEHLNQQIELGIRGVEAATALKEAQNGQAAAQ